MADAAITANSLNDVPVAKTLVEVMDRARKYPRHHSVVMQRKESDYKAERAPKLTGTLAAPRPERATDS